LLEPPIDTDKDSPEAVDGAPFRARHGVGERDLLVVAVSRLVGWLKLEGLARGIDAVGALAGRYPVRFVVVGSGTAEADLRSRAAKVNATAGREVVTVPGPMIDPREAYAAADVVLGMGGSALRGLSFGKPVVVVGENGFSELATPATVGPFLWRGYYGVGDGTPSDLVGQLERVLADAAERASLGLWARALVERRYALSSATRRLDGFLHEAVGFAGSRLARLREAAAMGSRSTAARLTPDALKERLRGRRPTNWVEVALTRGTQNR
jgi:glycosyltransferase involved in cell wall biosynthesis